IRVITATNRDLAEEVRKSRFREDLFYRLNVIHIHMPPLRDRKEDIPLLVEHFLVKFRHTPGAIPTAISEDALKQLVEYDWPGNVRELENAVERAVVLSRGNAITVEHLPFGKREERDRTNLAQRRSRLDDDESALAERRSELAVDEARTDADEVAAGDAGARDGAADAGDAGNGVGGFFKDRVASLERELIREALERAGGNRTKAAEELGIYRRLLYAKIKEYGLGE
ncbi:MAG TPA: helix-turn-helix domain-containing protein, partial [Methylomirabilota bacterium]|nr:helix-turn-helix domain-containing protein [Methylomirabilota bacterium]